MAARRQGGQVAAEDNQARSTPICGSPCTKHPPPCVTNKGGTDGLTRAGSTLLGLPKAESRWLPQLQVHASQVQARQSGARCKLAAVDNRRGVAGRPRLRLRRQPDTVGSTPQGRQRIDWPWTDKSARLISVVWGPSSLGSSVWTLRTQLTGGCAVPAGATTDLAHAAQVWNPGFDVTPARLITGIITERGLVPKSKAAFQVGSCCTAPIV